VRLKTLYVRFFKSFNYDYLRKSHPGAVPDPWDLLPGDDELFYPYVKVPVEAGITTVVGANESGKSQLISAIECLLSGEGIDPRDFCRYSEWFTVRYRMKLPEFGGEFSDLTEAETKAVTGLTGIDGDVSSFHLFRVNSGITIYAQGPTGWASATPKAADLKKLVLPTFFKIDAKTPLPNSVPISYLAGTTKAKLQSRKSRMAWLEKFLVNMDRFSSKDSLDKAVPELLADYNQLAGDVSDKDLAARLKLAEQLLIDVTGIGKDAFEQLQYAVKNHDGYANAIVAKMNEDLAQALNFPKWWSQDRDFSLALTLRDFDLILTVRDRTGSEYAFSERSWGMSYFLSYFVQYLSHRPTGGQEILLMDEPDAYLSMLGQQDLLKIFDSFAAPDEPDRAPVQVLYVTHSPFLIDKNHSERIRVLDKGDGEEGTRLVANAGRNHYEPLRSAFGAFVAETTFISNCNLMIEGQADQVLLAGLSSLARRLGSTKAALDLNDISLVPAGSAEHIPYMVYLARGRDVDKPAIIVLLDGDDEADKIAEELKKGYRGQKYIDDELVVRTNSIDPATVAVAVDAIREIEDLIPAELAALAIHRFAHEVLPSAEADSVAKQVTALTPASGEKLYEAAETLCAGLPEGLRLDKVGFARAVLGALDHDAKKELLNKTLANFESLFTLLWAAQRESTRRNSRERVRRTIARFNRAFLRDHSSSARRVEVTALLEDIESQLIEITDETEQIRSDLRLIRNDFKLNDEPQSLVDDFPALKDRLRKLVYVGVLGAQA
jgi:hypothetical protein